jgi:YYY domain-containing protein
MNREAGAPTKRAAALCSVTLLTMAAILRLHGLDWDQGQHLHPDERFLTMVETAIAAPHSIAEYFDTARSPLNPANHDYRFFVYGTLPLFLVRAVAGWLGLADYGHVHFVGRVMSGLFDLGTVWLTIVLGTRIAGRRVGLVAGALAAFSVTSIQNAHFFTVDSAAAFFATASLCALLRVADSGSLAAHVLFGALFGAMLGCRINLVLLAAVVPLGALHAWKVRRVSLGALAGGAGAAVLAAILVFRIVQPYAFAGPGLFGLAIAPDFLASIQQIRAFATGEADYPPGVQWIGRAPVLFAGRNLLLWGLGPAWGIAALGGIVWWLVDCVRRREGRSLIAATVLAWGLLLFGVHAVQFAATGRYFLPVVAVLAVFAAWPLAFGSGRARTALTAVLIVLTAAWAIAFTAIYRRPMTRVEASRWIYRNVPAGSRIATEHWDDGLPLALADVPRVAYRGIELHLYDEDTASKRQTLIDQLAETDYIMISSNRLYRSIPRAPWRYPLTRRYYELLFSGALGFRLERSFTSYPRLGPVEIADDEAEEAFTVYDHPHVLIFKKMPAFAREKVEEMLAAVPLTGIVRGPPRAASALYRKTRPTDIPLPESTGVRTAVARAEPTSFGALLRWAAAFESLSLAAFVLLFPAFRGTADRGFGLSKILAWLGPGYLAWLWCSIGLTANTAATARTIGLTMVSAAAAMAWLRRREIAAFVRSARRELVVIEAVFLATAALFLIARALNPAIFWGEKPMDFALLNSLVRARTMPPPDPWFAGGTLNYFYFGHALVAFFAEMSGVPPAFAFNLAIGTIAGLLAVAAFLVGRRLGGSLPSGVLAAFAVTMLGNLDGVRLLIVSPHRPMNFDYYWATSRVVDGTINEFPAWNLLFADLHAHVLAQPLEIALLYLGLLWLGSPGPSRSVVAVLVAWIAGAVATTSSWSVPTTLGLQFAFLVTAWRREPGRRVRGLGAVLLGWALIVLASRGLFWPFWANYGFPVGRSWGWETATAPLGDVLTIFGVFFLALAPSLTVVSLARRRGWGLLAAVTVVAALAAPAAVRSPSAGVFAAIAALGVLTWCLADEMEWQAVGGIVATAGALGVVTELVFLWDRMNTVFKYYLEMWLLLGCAAGGILPRAWRRCRRGHMPWAVSLAVLGAAGLFTTLSGAYGLLRFPFAASEIPTLDGMNYLRRARPGELAAYRWLDREVRGVPVLLEAHGDSYGEFSRVSMNTGLPTVLGWEYHLFQQAHSWPEIQQRRDDVRTLYETTDLELAESLMRRYHVDLVFIGGLERRTYPPAGLAKFATWSLTRPVFESGGVSIYATPGVLDTVKTWVEPVAAAPGAASQEPLGSYREPRDVARAPDGTLYVADFGNRRIQRVDSQLRAIGGFGAEGDAPGQFRDPCGLAVGDDGRVYVADTWNHRIQKLSAKGEPIAEWTAGFYGPRGIALDHAGRIYVADTGNRRVVRLSAAGVPEREWGRTGDALSEPVGIAVSAQDEVYVADTGHQRIAVFSPDGELLRQWPIDGWKSGTLREPHLDVGSDGVVWVADPSGDRVLLFDANGRPLGVAQTSRALSVPTGIALVDSGHAVVANAGSHSLAVVSRTANTSVVPE